MLLCSRFNNKEMAECGQVILSPVAHFQQILSLDSKQLGGVMFVSHFHEIEVS